MSLAVVFGHDDLVVFQAKNPKRRRSSAWGRYERYKVATTVGQARELGATGDDLRHDARHGFVAVTPAQAPGMAAGALPCRDQAPEIAEAPGMAAGALPCRDQAPEIAEAPGMAAGALPCRDQAPEIAGQEEVVPEKEGEEQERKEQEEEEEEKVEEDEEESSEGYQRSLMHASEGGKKGYWVASLPEGGHVQWSWHPSKRKAEYAASLERRGKGPGHWVLVLKCESGGGKPLALGPFSI